MIGLLHPGEMGAAVGRTLRAAGMLVCWTSAGRSARTVERAAAADLTDAGTVEALLAESDVVLSICPPLAGEWAELGLTERYQRAGESAASKGWRWVGEMEQIAAAPRVHDLPDGFHLAAAEMFRR